MLEWTGIGVTYISMEGVAVKVPCLKELHTLASILSPRIAVRQWCVEREGNDASSQEGHDASSSNRRGIFDAEGTSNSIRCKVVDLAHRDDGKIKGGKVVVKE